MRKANKSAAQTRQRPAGSSSGTCRNRLDGLTKRETKPEISLRPSAVAGDSRVLRMGSLPIAVNFVDIEGTSFSLLRLIAAPPAHFQVDHQSRTSAANIFASSPGVALWRLPQRVGMRRTRRNGSSLCSKASAGKCPPRKGRHLGVKCPMNGGVRDAGGPSHTYDFGDAISCALSCLGVRLLRDPRRQAQVCLHRRVRLQRNAPIEKMQIRPRMRSRRAWRSRL